LTGDNYESLANNFLYLKDVKFESHNTKEYMINFHNQSCELKKINKLHYEDTGIEIEDNFEVKYLYLFWRDFSQFYLGYVICSIDTTIF